MSKECLQTLTGSCRGCGILEMVIKRANNGHALQSAAEGIRVQYCPEGAYPQTHLINKVKLPGMGQGDSGLVRIG